jgi:hypothetical protein
MSTVYKLIPQDESLSALTLSSSGSGIWLDQGNEAMLPVPVLNETYAESPETEGSRRMTYKPANAVGSLKLNINGLTHEEFRANVDKLQRYVNSINAYGGEAEYTPDSGSAITYDVVSASVVSLPQDGIWLPQNVSQAEVSITYAPYGRLAPIEVFKELESTQPVTSFDVGDRAYEQVILGDEPVLYWRMGTGGITDKSGKGNNGTAAGGISIGASLGALANDEDGSTTFDGVDDHITSLYSTPHAATATPYTIEGWAYRSSTGAVHTLYGGFGNSAIHVTISSGNQTVNWGSSETPIFSWVNAWPGVNKWVHWAVSYTNSSTNENPLNTVELFINGVSKGAKYERFFGSGPEKVILGAWGDNSAPLAPFAGKMDEFAIYEHRLTPEQIFHHYTAGAYRVAVPGSAPALVELTVDDTTGTNRDYFEYGLDDSYNPYSASQVLIDSPGEVTTSGFAGANASRTGAYSATGSETNVIRATLYTRPVAMCSFTSSTVGKTRVKARVYGGSETSSYVRLSWRIGEGQFTNNSWLKMPNTAGFWELDLGVLNSPKAAVGSQLAEGYIEAYAAANGTSLDLDYLTLFPLASYGKASATQSNEASAAPLMVDDFLADTNGSLSGKALVVGGSWETIALSTGTAAYAISEHQAQYSATTAETGKKSIARPTGVAGVGAATIQWDASYTTTAATFAANYGAVLRYQDVNNYVRGAMFVSQAGGVTGWYLEIIKVKGGVESGISYVFNRFNPLINTFYTYAFSIDENGNYGLEAGAQGGALTAFLAGNDPDLASTGALGTGSIGLFGAPTASTASTSTTLTWDNVVAFGLSEPEHTINANKSLELTSSGLHKEPVSGTVWTPETLDGGYPKVPPARTSRLVVRTRKNNVNSHQDSSTWTGQIAAGKSTFSSGFKSTTGTLEQNMAQPAASGGGTLLIGAVGYGSSAEPHGVTTMGYAAGANWPTIKTGYGLYSFYYQYQEGNPTLIAVSVSGTTSEVFAATVAAFNGADLSAPINASAKAEGTGTTVTWPSVTTTEPNCMIVLALGMQGAESAPLIPSVTGYTTAGSVRTTGTYKAASAIYYPPGEQQAPGASGTVTTSISPSYNWIAHTIAIKRAKPLDGFKASLKITPRVQLTSK